MPIWLQMARSYNNPDSVNYKIAYLREQTSKNLGYLSFEEQVQLAMLGNTIIQGGYLNTELIKAKSIVADQLNVDDLAAISANIGDVTAGSLTGITITGSTILTAATGTRAEMGGGSTPYFDTYVGNIKRMRLESDRLNFYDQNGVLGGYIQGWDTGGASLLRIGGKAIHVATGTEFAVWEDAYFFKDVYIYQGNLDVAGTLTKGSGTFKIDHPLDSENKYLIHGFVEAPRYDLIYRGIAKLDNGQALVNIDEESNMTNGTFAELTQNAVVTSLCNQDGFARVKPSTVENGEFTIICEDENCTDNVAWVVMAERADKFIFEGKTYTDANGRLVPEQDKPE